MCLPVRHSGVSRPAIEPELREFIDEVLVPMLVRDALKEIRGSESELAQIVSPVAQSARTQGAA